LGRRIRPVALALIRHGGSILVEQGRDEVKGETFFRLLGGSIDFQELAADTIRRELDEELGAEVDVVGLVATVENVFTYEGEAAHEIHLIYDCRLREERLYSLAEWEATEGSVVHRVSWKRIDSFRSGEEILYPAEVLSILS
jgi:8-oxo-dGTP pyrophosphatase MutT (NUDIX family)